MIIVLCIILWIKSCWIGNFLYHSFFNRCIWQDIKWFKISTGLSFAEIQSYLRIIKGPPLFHIPSVQHISSTQKGHFFLAPKIPQFHIENQSVQETPQFYTKKPSVPHQKLQFHTPLSSNWSGNEGCVELEGFWCETEEVLLLNWGGSDMELRDIRC